MHPTPEEIYRTRKQFFNDKAESWLDMFYKNPDTGSYDRHQQNFERLFSLVPLIRGCRVLDAGCGSGILVPSILTKIGESGMLYELDFAEKMIAENKRLHREGNIRFIVADAAETPLEAETCDVVFCFACFPHFQDKEKVMRCLSRILKPGGTFVIAHFESSEGIKRHHEACPAVAHDLLPTENEMRSLFQKAALSIDLFVDEQGFYCVRAKKIAPFQNQEEALLS